MWSPNGGNAAVSSPGGALLPSFLTRSCVPAPVELGGGSSLEVAAAALSAAAEDQTGKWRPFCTPPRGSDGTLLQLGGGGDHLITPAVLRTGFRGELRRGEAEAVKVVPSGSGRQSGK
jgi:hypothetical protein